MKLKFAMVVVFSFVFSLFLYACAPSVPPCTPNQTSICACPGNKQGVQTCQQSGQAWTKCDCSSGEQNSDDGGTVSGGGNNNSPDDKTAD